MERGGMLGSPSLRQRAVPSSFFPLRVIVRATVRSQFLSAVTAAAVHSDVALRVTSDTTVNTGNKGGLIKQSTAPEGCLHSDGLMCE